MNYAICNLFLNICRNTTENKIAGFGHFKPLITTYATCYVSLPSASGLSTLFACFGEIEMHLKR